MKSPCCFTMHRQTNMHGNMRHENDINSLYYVQLEWNEMQIIIVTVTLDGGCGMVMGPDPNSYRKAVAETVFRRSGAPEHWILALRGNLTRWFLLFPSQLITTAARCCQSCFPSATSSHHPTRPPPYTRNSNYWLSNLPRTFGISAIDLLISTPI